MKGLEDKQEKMFLEDKDTVTGLIDFWYWGWDNVEIYDKDDKEFIDKSNWSDEDIAKWITDLMMWNGREISEEEYRKKLGNKAKESKVL